MRRHQIPNRIDSLGLNFLNHFWPMLVDLVEGVRELFQDKTHKEMFLPEICRQFRPVCLEQKEGWWVRNYRCLKLRKKSAAQEEERRLSNIHTKRFCTLQWFFSFRENLLLGMLFTLPLFPLATDARWMTTGCRLTSLKVWERKFRTTMIRSGSRVRGGETASSGLRSARGWTKIRSSQ